MSEMPRVRRARFGNHSNYTAATLQTYEARSAAYERAALAAGEAIDAPSAGWLASFLRAKAAALTPESARSLLRAISYRFEQKGLALPADREEILDMLFAMDNQDAIAAGLCRRHRARPFIDNALKPQTIAVYKHWSNRWQAYAGAARTDALRAPLNLYLEWLTSLGDSYQWHTVRNAVFGTSWYFRRHAATDLAYHKLVWKLLDGLGRVKPPLNLIPYTPEQIESMMACLGNAPLDIRDGVLILAIYLGHLRYRQLGVDLGLVRFTTDGVYIPVVERFRSEAFIGGVENPLLDIRVWMRRWCVIRGDVGPLAASVRGGSWSTMPLTEGAISQALRRVARLAGSMSPKLGMAMRRAFIIRALPHVGATVLAKFAGYARVRSVLELAGGGASRRALLSNAKVRSTWAASDCSHRHESERSWE